MTAKWARSAWGVPLDSEDRRASHASEAECPVHRRREQDRRPPVRCARYPSRRCCLLLRSTAARCGGLKGLRSTAARCGGWKGLGHQSKAHRGSGQRSATSSADGRVSWPNAWREREAVCRSPSSPVALGRKPAGGTGTVQHQKERHSWARLESCRGHTGSVSREPPLPAPVGHLPDRRSRLRLPRLRRQDLLAAVPKSEKYSKSLGRRSRWMASLRLSAPE